MSELNTSWVVEVNNISKAYADGNRKVQVLNNLNLSVAAGQRIAILGASGSGKSTLLHVLGGLDHVDSGEVKVGGEVWTQMTEAQRALKRNLKVGFVYQFHHLLPEFTAVENVAMPLRWRGIKSGEANEQAAYWLSRVGLGARFDHTPSQMSGGERQRVAVARALVTTPQLVLADEPTGNLDGDNAKAVFDLFLELCTTNNAALVLVTHDQQLAASCDQVYQMDQGHLQQMY